MCPCAELTLHLTHPRTQMGMWADYAAAGAAMSEVVLACCAVRRGC
jgi:hypothetical protein